MHSARAPMTSRRADNYMIDVTTNSLHITNATTQAQSTIDYISATEYYAVSGHRHSRLPYLSLTYSHTLLDGPIPPCTGYEMTTLIPRISLWLYPHINIPAVVMIPIVSTTNCIEPTLHGLVSNTFRDLYALSATCAPQTIPVQSLHCQSLL